jgi:hypothetical protein
MFLGVSPEHSSNVVLALNLNMRYVSPKFHTVHDDLFSTVSSEWDSKTLTLTIGRAFYSPATSAMVIPILIHLRSPMNSSPQLNKQLKNNAVFFTVVAMKSPVRGSCLLRQDHLRWGGGGLPQPTNLLPSQNPTQVGPHQVGPPHNKYFPAPVPLPPLLPSPTLDLEPDPNPSPTQDMSEESDSPVARITRTRSGRQRRPQSRMNLHTTKKHFRSDMLPVYTGNQYTQ